MSEFRFSAVVCGNVFGELRRALLSLSPPMIVRNDTDFEWRMADMDLNFRLEDGDYLGTGFMSCDEPAAVARCVAIANALEREGLHFKIELDREDVEQPIFERGEYRPFIGT